jgi:rubrerythrin
MRKPIQSCEKILEEFRIILELEKKAAETYHQLAQDCDHPEVAQVLEKISREECEHAAIAARLVNTAEHYAKKSLNIPIRPLKTLKEDS